MKYIRQFLSLIYLTTAAIVIFTSFPSAANAESVKVGVFAPLSGHLAHFGTDAVRAAQYAAEQVNSAGGINGSKVELIVYDDRGNRTEAVSVVRKLMEHHSVVAVISASASLTSIAAAPIINQAKVPMVVAFSNAVGVVKGNDYVFRFASVGNVQGWVMAHDAVVKRGYKTFALFMQDEEYGRSIIDGAEKGIEKWGGKVVYKRAFSPGEKEFRSFLTEIKHLKVDAVIIGGFGSPLTAIGRQGYELEVFPAAQMYGGCAMSDSDWYAGIGDHGGGALAALEFIATADTPIANNLRKVWEEKYGGPVTHTVGLTYDAARWLFDAMKRGGNTRAEIRTALAETKSFINMSGAEVTWTELREPMLPIAIGEWDTSNHDFRPVEIVSEPNLIDPRPWYRYYE